jgi:predicted dehydrogenase
MNRVAILGAGIGRQHLQALRTLPDQFSVAMVVDQNIERIEEIREVDTFRSATTIDAALNDPDIDLIDVCLPPHLHVATTLAALEAGKHVVCEKPLATNLADVDRIRAGSIRHKRRVFPVFQFRWGPPLAHLRALMDAGIAGAAQVGAIDTHWSRGADYYAVPWRGTWAGEQGGAVLGHAIHNHDLMTHFMGPVAAVSAMTTTWVNPIETEDCAALSFQMASGALCTSSITLGAAFDQTRIRLVFEHLTATSGTAPYAPGSEDWHFVARDPAKQSLVDKVLAHTKAEPVGFAGFFAALADTMAGRASQAVTLDEGAASVELVTAIYHAARTGQRVSLPLGPYHPLYNGWQPAN